MTDDQLKGIAAQALNLIKLEIERQGEFGLFLASWNASDQPPLHRMTQIERLLEDKLGRGWLNKPSAKETAFGILRMATEAFPPDALVLVTATNEFRSTAAFKALPEQEQRRIIEAGHDEHHRAAAKGLLTLSDAVTAVVQTPDRVCVCTQILDGRKQPDGPPQIQCGPQSQFGGRLKMYGDQKPEFNFTKKNT